jgi:ATP-binding cassette subfamily F protein 3
MKQIERMEKIEAPVASERTVAKFRFPQPARSGTRVITLKDVRHAYGDLVVYERLDFEAERGARTVLVGPNGAGKSTLLKLLGGVLDVQQGTREPGHNVKVGYFAQHRVAQLHPKHTVLQSALDSPNPVGEEAARTVLGSFLFRGDDVFKPVARAQRWRKVPARAGETAARSAEPPAHGRTDHAPRHRSIDALIGALRQFEGTLIFISHDVHFIRQLASTVLHITAGRLTPYAGGYDYYLEKSGATSARAALTVGATLQNQQPAMATKAVGSTAPGMKESREQRRAEAEERKAAAKAERERKSQIEHLEMRILHLEGRQQELTAQLEKPETYAPGGAAMQLNRELLVVQDDLARTTAEWEALGEAN